MDLLVTLEEFGTGTCRYSTVQSEGTAGLSEFFLLVQVTALQPSSSVQNIAMDTNGQRTQIKMEAVYQASVNKVSKTCTTQPF